MSDRFESMLAEHLKRLRSWKSGKTDLQMADDCFCSLPVIINWRENHKLAENK